ncbi:Neuronal pentraxin-2 [Desmophyllum pertusum]|uniref:Pentraxin family member n=1 Tax=Desmophyllum pertusum TaxID=174260 RepID=A0A9W9ZKT0_9CNID|nr:Neuronal pentraxin-2 [Desmophyllum pertusum]
MIFLGIPLRITPLKANAIGSSLSAFTVCFFVKLKAVSGSNGYRSVYSYAVEGSGSQLGMISMLNSFQLLQSTLELGKKMPRTTRSKIEDDQWHHVCATWENSKGDWQLYMDGQLRENGTGMRKNRVIKSGGTVVFGQDQIRLEEGSKLATLLGLVN